MSDPTASADDRRRDERADELNPEERAAGSADPRAQAAAVLADSDDRERSRMVATDAQEHRGPAGEQPAAG